MKTHDLVKHWVHSHEEDSGAKMVFRPASYAFPRSRGRTSFELRADGTLVEHGPGPGDAGSASTGKWRELPDARIVFSHDGSTQPARAFEILRAEPDQLVVKRLDV